MKIVIHILALLILSAAISSAQTTNQNILSGKVYDSVTLAPLQNASVYLSGTTIGTAANIKGYFEIQNIPSGRYQLVI